MLRYLRRGVLPVFYDHVRGHDHALYRALLHEARYFQIDRLEAWIGDKSYLQEVKVMHSAEVVESADQLLATLEPNTEVQYYPTWTTKKVYVCPRGIYGHNGNPSACGRQCMKAQGDAENDYVDEAVLKVLVIKKQAVFK